MTTDFERMARWIADGEVGLSSKSIAMRMCGIGPPKTWGWSYPHDPADFCRCQKLLDRYPEWRARLGEMAEVHPVWAALAPKWDEIDRCFDAEVGRHWQQAGRRAERTYLLMKSIISPVEIGDRP